MSNVVNSRIAPPQQLGSGQQQQQKKKGTDLDWLRPIGTAASMFGFPYISMAIGAYDMFNGDPSGVFNMIGGGQGAGGGDVFSNILRGGQFNPYGSFGPALSGSGSAAMSGAGMGAGFGGGGFGGFKMNDPDQFDFVGGRYL